MSITKGTWHTGEQLQEHKLACSVINLHGTLDCVFDEEQLDLLQRFTLSRSLPTRDQMMQEKGWDDEAGTGDGMKAGQARSLTGYIIARYGTDDEVLDDRDWELLDEWFRKGRPVGENVQR